MSNPIIFHTKSDWKRYIDILQILARIKKTLIKYETATAIIKGESSSNIDEIYNQFRKEHKSQAVPLWITCWDPKNYLDYQIHNSVGLPIPQTFVQYTVQIIDKYYTRFSLCVQAISEAEEERKFHVRKIWFEDIENMIFNQPLCTMDFIIFFDTILVPIYERVYSPFIKFLAEASVRDIEKRESQIDDIIQEFELICQADFSIPSEYRSISNKL